MAWYYILFFAALIFFLIKFTLTLIAGDVDFDVDVDGDVDFDVSSLFSFKGVLHFILGFSSYLSLIAKMNTISNEVYVFSFGQYVIGVCIGILFMVGLYYLYKVMMKLNHYNNTNFDVNNYLCTILISHGLVDIDAPAPDGSGHDHAYAYTVLINTEVGSRKITVLSEKGNLSIGSEHRIYVNNEGIYYI